MTHSLLFAGLLSAVLVGMWSKQKTRAAQVGIFVYLFFCTASHGVLDALTDGGLGVAFFSPFDTSRYFFSARPVAVSPIGISAFFSVGGRSRACQRGAMDLAPNHCGVPDHSWAARCTIGSIGFEASTARLITLGNSVTISRIVNSQEQMMYVTRLTLK